ncbi:cytochrome c-type biogenesis protein CcmF [Abditibacteriota bacterium]|nr:cytochrome c-type biogenesis protein CcmF [Abditibacteriota bacterium]
MLLATLGHWLVLLAMMACALNIGATAFSYHPAAKVKRSEWLETAHNASFVTWAFVAAACALMIFAFLTNNFALQYVWENSSRAQPLPFKISALWGGQGGSLMLWTFVLATYGILVSRGGRRSGQELSPIAASVMCFVTLFFAGLVAFAASPWVVMEQIPQDGRGMNPLLQNYWMQIHPPTLYTGYVGCTVPFAFAVAALFHRKFDEVWVTLIRRWVLFTWIVLTVGIVLGGVWAYETLGWGGYWAWDPVENASLMPWLSATAFLHSIMLQGRRGLLKNWNIALVTLTFLLSVFGTFLTRSGVVQSVHSFAESGIGGYFLGFLGFALVATMVLIYWRRSELVSDARIESALSREGAFMLNNFLLLGCTLAVLLGTVYPTLSEAIGNERVNVSKDYFNSTMAPLGLLLLALTGIGPLLAWRRTTVAGIWKVLKFPVLWSLAFSPVLWFLAQWRTGAATAFTLSFFVFMAIGFEFFRGVKALRNKRNSTVLDASADLISFNPARYGGYIVHLGVAVMFVGLTGSSLFKVETQSMLLHKGEKMNVGEYILRFDGLERPKDLDPSLRDQMNARITVFDANGQVTSEERPMRPHIDFFAAATASDPQTKDEEGQSARRPSIRSTLANDLYLVLDGFDSKDNSASIKAYMNPLVMWIWISQGFFILGTLVAFIPPRRNPVVRSVVREGAPAVKEAPRERELVA